MSARSDYKFKAALELAKQASRDSWNPNTPKHHRKAYRQIRIEAMQDARMWRS
jgi:hypothetical protein